MCGSAENMNKRKLGTSSIEVSVVGLGCNNFGRRMYDLAPIRAVVHRALDLGVTLFDTAEIYGEGGKSEQFLGQVFGERRKDIDRHQVWLRRRRISVVDHAIGGRKP